ncbi:MAG: class I SAM-dependent methyltransferase [Anaerolineae bacterium]|jgi:SAM-dependent methyltransferase|nr:class I SAM-dependent methyltransferase [Anaerolineae bacterium]
MSSPFHDPKRFKRFYETDRSIRDLYEAREQFAHPRMDFAGWALRGLRWRGDERVLDVGCGYGAYYDRLSQAHPNIDYFGLDQSLGMLAHHAAAGHGRLLVGDATHLPFPDDSFDVVMANHMLYHLPDLDSAMREIKRVLKPEGVLMATTHSNQTIPEIRMLIRRAIIILTRANPSSVRPPTTVSDLFSLESGTRVLSRHFYGVCRFEIPSTLIFHTEADFLSYLAQLRDLLELSLPVDVTWEGIMEVLRDQVAQFIYQLGDMQVSRLAGVLIASDKGDFLRQFLQVRDKA